MSADMSRSRIQPPHGPANASPKPGFTGGHLLITDTPKTSSPTTEQQIRGADGAADLPHPFRARIGQAGRLSHRSGAQPIGTNPDLAIYASGLWRGKMAQNKIVRHDTMERLGAGLRTFVLAALMAGWVLALVWLANLLMALDGSQ